MPMRTHRGLTFVTVLILLGVAVGTFWVLTYGEAYWDNTEVKALTRYSANACYNQKNDAIVKAEFWRKLHDLLDVDVVQGGKTVRQLKIEADPEDLRLERTETPPHVDIWFTYNRTVKVPLLGQTRVVQFVDHAEQDLSLVKW